VTPEHIVLLLAAFNFGAIGFVGMILTPMLIWRFPDGEAAEVLQPVLPVFLWCQWWFGFTRGALSLTVACRL